MTELLEQSDKAVATITLLAPDQEAFCRLMVERSSTQLTAYDLAFPENKGTWDSRKGSASRLFRLPKIQARMIELRHADQSQWISTKHEKLLQLAGIRSADISEILDEDGMIDPKKIHLLPKGAVAKIKVVKKSWEKDGYAGEDVSAEVVLRDPLAAIKLDNEMQGHSVTVEKEALSSLASILASMNNNGKTLPSAAPMAQNAVDVEAKPV
jgi:hypothetical protein